MKIEDISPSLSLIDKSFNRESSGNYHLSFIIGLSGFAYCILDVKQNIFLALEEIHFQREQNYSSLCQKLESFISESDILSAVHSKRKFKSVSIGIYNETSTLIPAALFDETKKNEFLKLNFSRENIFSANDFLPVLDAYLIYEFSETIQKTFNEIFSKVKIFHFSSPLIESLLEECKYKNETRAYLHFFQKSNYGNSSHFEIIILQNEKLIFFNSFLFYQKEDIGYYLLFVLQQLNINPGKLKIVLLGNIQKTDETIELLNNYVKSVEFGNRPLNFEYSSVFDELPAHFYYSLLSQYLFV